MPEAVVRLAVDEAESRPLVGVTGSVKDVIRPERDPFVVGRPGEADALVDQSRADPQPAGEWLDQPQVEPRDRLRPPGEKWRASDLVVALGDPAPVPLRIV